MRANVEDQTLDRADRLARQFNRNRGA